MSAVLHPSVLLNGIIHSCSGLPLRQEMYDNCVIQQINMATTTMMMMTMITIESHSMYFAILVDIRKTQYYMTVISRHCKGYRLHVTGWWRCVAILLRNSKNSSCQSTTVIQESLANAKVSARQPCTSKTDFDMK